MNAASMLVIEDLLCNILHLFHFVCFFFGYLFTISNMFFIVCTLRAMLYNGVALMNSLMLLIEKNCL